MIAEPMSHETLTHSWLAFVLDQEEVLEARGAADRLEEPEEICPVDGPFHLRSGMQRYFHELVHSRSRGVALGDRYPRKTGSGTPHAARQQI